MSRDRNILARDPRAAQQALDLFRAHEKGLIRGAFLRVTDRKVGRWVNEGLLRLIFYKRNVVAAAVVVPIRARQTIKDFSGNERAEIARGDLIVRRFACWPGHEELLERAFLKLSAQCRRIWFRIWQEHQIDRAIMRRVSANYVCTKVLSGSELVGVWYLGEATKQRAMAKSENCDVCKLRKRPLRVSGAKIAVLNRSGELVTHYSTKYNAHASWAAFAIRGYGGRTDVILKPKEMPKVWKAGNREKLAWKLRDTPARKVLPELEPIIAAIPGTKHRIRIMKLAAGGEIARHSDAIDKDAGTLPGKVLRIHVPISTNPKVWFTCWDLDGHPRRVHMREGEAWYLDTRKPHEVENLGSTDRLHLVMDVVSCPELVRLLEIPCARMRDGIGREVRS